MRLIVTWLRFKQERPIQCWLDTRAAYLVLHPRQNGEPS